MVQIPPELRFKFSPQLLAQIQQEPDPPVKVIIQIAPGQLESAMGAISSLGSVEWTSQLTNQISMTIDETNLPALARYGTVVSIFHVPQGTIHQKAGIEPILGLAPAAVNVTLEETTTYIGAPKLWDKGFKGAGVKVGVVDTGMDATHPMLQGRIAAEKFFAGTGPEDNNGHGTWVASCIAGNEWMSADGPLIGVAPEAQLVNAKAFDGPTADLDVIMQAMEWAVLQGVQVLSNSWGGNEDFPPLHDLVVAIRSKGVIVVASNGNDGPDPGTVDFPAAYPEVLGVGSTAVLSPAPDAVASFSSRGPGPGGIIKPNLCAPGGSEEEAITGAAPNDGTAALRGTSMSCPHVSGSLALLISAGLPTSPPARLIGTAPNNDSGYGVLSVNSTGQPIPVTGTVSVTPTDLAPLLVFGVIAGALFWTMLS